jgi:Zn-dependent peptidase ImmA (M78 family)
MVLNKVKYNHNMIEIALVSRGILQNQLSEMMNVPQSTISKWYRGQLLPKDSEYEKIAELTDYPLHFFEQNIEILPDELIYYRKKSSAKPKELKKNKYLLFILKYGLKEMLRAIDLPNDVPYMNTLDNGNPETIARNLRKYWKIPKGPIPNIVKYLERAGILIFTISADSDEFSGQVLPDEDGLPIICINKNLSGDRQRNTLAHELGHLIMHTNKYMSRRGIDPEEEVKRFVGEFLMPEEEIRSDLIATDITLRSLASLKSYWGISMASLAYRAKQLGIIENGKFVSLYVQLGQHGYRKKEPNMGVFPESPTLVRQIIELHLTKLDYSEADLAHLMCLNLKEFKSFYDLHKPKSTLKIL